MLYLAAIQRKNRPNAAGQRDGLHEQVGQFGQQAVKRSVPLGGDRNHDTVEVLIAVVVEADPLRLLGARYGRVPLFDVDVDLLERPLQQSVVRRLVLVGNATVATGRGEAASVADNVVHFRHASQV